MHVHRARADPSAAPIRMSCSETSTALDPNSASVSSRMIDAGDDRRRAVGVEPAHLPALGERQRGEAVEDPPALRGADHVPLDLVRVVGLELLGDRGHRGRGSRHRDRVLDTAAALLGGTPRPRIARTSRASSSSSVAARRIGVQVALGLANDAGLVGDVEGHLAAGPDHELGRAAADVDHERRGSVGRVALAGGAEEREPRLLVPGQDVRLEPPARRRRPPANSAPLAASRTALVSTATRVGAAVAVDQSPGTRRAPRTRAASRPRSAVRPASTPAPRRVITVRALQHVDDRSRRTTSARNSRVEFVPMSMTARRTQRVPT